MLIRLARNNDLPALMSLVRRVVPLMQAAGNFQWDDQYPNPQVFERDIELGQLWVADPENGSLAGVAAITTDQEPEYAQVGWDIQELAIVVHRLAVDPEYRGAGIASALMKQAEAVARNRGISVLRVDTNTQNEATQRLFPKLGYRLAGEIGLSFRAGLRFLCYEKRLAQAASVKRIAAIAIGSNMPSLHQASSNLPVGPGQNLQEAIERIRQLGEVLAVSSFYDTAPVGFTDQPRFVNAALLLATTLEPLELMRELLAIERAMGRERTSVPAKGPRVIDLDLLLMDNLVVHCMRSDDGLVELTLPHPAMAERRFVLEPLADVAPGMVHPVLLVTVRELLGRLQDEINR